MKSRRVNRKKYIVIILVVSFCFGLNKLDSSSANKEFKVNTYNYRVHLFPAVVMDKEGNFIVTWSSHEPFFPLGKIYARRFNSEGKAENREFRVSADAQDTHREPAIAMDEKGNFVITWWKYKKGVVARKYSNEAKAIVAVFKVNKKTTGSSPAIAMDKRGNFVVVWQYYGKDGSKSGIYAKRFNSRCEPVAPEFQVNTYTDDAQFYPAITMNKKGRFVIVWISNKQDGSGYGIYGQMYNKHGKTMGSEFRVNTVSKRDQEFPAVAMDERGNFVVTWRSEGKKGTGRKVFTQIYNKNGKAIGFELQVDTNGEKGQKLPAIGMDKKRNFIITWESDLKLLAQRFSNRGKVIGSEFQVNVKTEAIYAPHAGPYGPSIAINEEGNNVIVWTGISKKEKYEFPFNIYARIFKLSK